MRNLNPPLIPYMRIALMGGSFDPPHKGHLLVAENAIRALQLDCVIWLVAQKNPLKQHRPAPLKKRLEQATALAHKNPKIRVMADPYIYAIDTIRHFCDTYNKSHFVWLMGTDLWGDFHRWRHWQDIVHTCPIALYPRPPSVLSCVHSVAATRFAPYRLPLEELAHLPITPAPAWGILGGKRTTLSSTALRH